MRADSGSLMQLKQKIDDLTAKKNKIEGQLERVMVSIEELTGCKTIDEAGEDLEEKITACDKRRAEFDKAEQKLREDFDGIFAND